MEESALTLEALLQQKARSFETLKRHCNSVKRVVGDQITVAGLQNRLRLISRIWELCVITDTQIQNLRTPSSKDAYFLQKHFEEAEEFFLTYNDYILKKDYGIGKPERHVVFGIHTDFPFTVIASASPSHTTSNDKYS